MSTSSIIYLMYHELEVPGQVLCNSEPGYERYVLLEREFREQVDFLKARGYRGVSVDSALAFSEGSNSSTKASQNTCITFDDGSETDLLAAAPILHQAGFGATFYITVGWLGKPGHLSALQLKELSAQGFEIGCHSMTHPMLTDLDEAGLQHEIVDAKSQLEQIVGKPVEHFSCPGGRYDDRVVRIARAAGYRTVATSGIHANSPDTDLFALGRVAILRGTPVKDFAAICSGDALRRLRAQGTLRDAAKQLLGNSFYDRVREVLLGGRRAQ
jgi:peptidoglycan/xylan/chitin deacetylase (PgdA/CDA1 family)